MYVYLPSETDATGIAHTVTQDLAGEDLVGRKDSDELLLPMSVRNKEMEARMGSLQPR